MTNENLTIPQGLDPEAVNLARSIRKQESGGDYQKPGDSGSSLGAYQWNNQPNGKSIPLQKGELPSNFQSDAKAAGLDPTDFSPHNQDMVAYNKIKKLKDSGKNVVDIAAIWNGGDSRRQNPNYITQSGLPSQKAGVYDVPAYAKAVNDNYQNLKTKTSGQTQQQGFNPNPYSNPTNGNQVPVTGVPEPTPKTPDTLGAELTNRGAEVTQGINSIVGGKQGTGQTRASGLLQTVGAVAGGLGDVVNKGLELIPGVKQVENLLGQGIGALAKTPVGQSVMKSVQDFSTSHPELAKDIGAGFNIVTAIPILRGLGVAGKLGMEAGSQALKDVVAKGFAKDLETSGGKIAQKAFTPEVVDTSIKYGVAPEIKSVGGKTVTDTTLAQKNLEKEVSRIENDVYQPALKGIDLKFPMEGVKNVANDISIENLSDPSAVNKILDRVALKYGPTPTLEQLNQAKRDITKKISQNGFADPDLSNNRIARMALQKTIEQNSLQFGGGNIQAINQEMGNILKTLNFYGKIDGMSVKQGLLHQGIKAVSTATGAGIGGMLGNPIAGGALGYGASDLIEGQLGKLAPRSVRAGIIKRTGANATKVSREEMLKKLPGLFAGAVNVK